ncbi:MAG TPA: hypothetical protein VFM55_07300 [Micromonosporaceae bacterium]|nr:hypothetical protein [Micromonosporaceae bacterium]
MQRHPVTDLVVFVPGIQGSILARDGTPVWSLSPGAGWRGLRTALSSVADLRLPDGIGDSDPGDGVVATDVMGSLHVVPGVWSVVVGYRGLLRWMRRSFTVDPDEAGRPGNLMVFAYDWRLSNRFNACRLEREVLPALERWRAAGHPDAKVTFVCHSMGGLLVRYFLEVRGGAQLCHRLVTMGTPYRGSLAALRYLVDGFRIGGWEIEKLSRLARSLPSLHQLVPAYDCVVVGGGLVHLRDHKLDGPDPGLLSDAFAFHDEIAAAVARRGDTDRYEVHPIIGYGQPTPTTVRPGAAGCTWDNRIDGEDEGGDGRVPFLSGLPLELQRQGPRERAHLEAHGALADHRGVREGVKFALTQQRRFHRGPVDAVAFGVDGPETVPAGSSWTVTVMSPDDGLALSTKVTSALEPGPSPSATLANLGGGRYAHTFPGLPAGLYEVSTTAAGTTQAVTTYLTVWQVDDG